MADLPSIVHIMPAEPYGGLQALVIELARAQWIAGKSVEIILLGASDRVEARARSAGIVPIVLGGSKLLRMFALQRILRRFGPAILHSHCEPIWASLVLVTRRQAWIVHLHVYALQKTLRDRMGNLIRRLCTRQFMAITQSVADSYVGMGLVPAGRVHIVHNGLDLATLHQPARAASKEPLTVAFVGRAVREKGLFDFIETADLLRDDPRIRFVVAGEGGDLAEARTIIAERGLAGRVSVLGFVEDTNALWRDTDILLMLSTREPFGLVILEAIASGVAVIGYDIPSGGSEIMAKIPGCRMVPAFSIRALAGEVLYASADHRALSEQICEGQRVVANSFSLDRMEKDVARIYELLLLNP